MPSALSPKESSQRKPHSKSCRSAAPSRTRYYVDIDMCGGELFENFNLYEFCELLQELVPAIEVVPVLNRTCRPVGTHQDLVSPSTFDQALVNYYRQPPKGANNARQA